MDNDAGVDQVTVTVAGETYVVLRATADRIRRIAAADLNWTGGAGQWAAGPGVDTYRIWRQWGKKEDGKNGCTPTQLA